MHRKIKRGVFILTAIIALVPTAQAIDPTVIDFDDLSYDTDLTGSGYAGLTWETGNEGYQDIDSPHYGYWAVPPSDVITHPYSQPHCVDNGWGATLMGIGFPETVNVLGAYFASVGSSSPWLTTGVRVHGYLDDSEVAVTDWFNDIDTTPNWFAVNLSGVNRIVIESVTVKDNAGFYSMDDLTYTVVPEPATILLFSLGVPILSGLRKRTR
jgi:hypothetical protein